MKLIQKDFSLPAFRRGFHLITRHVQSAVPELQAFRVGVAHLFIRHTSASIALNENADPTVRHDFEEYFNRLVPEQAPYFKHTLEGPDDMPAHLKAALLGSSLQLPIANGKFHLGTWQGIYLCEHRNHASGREFTLTAWGN